MEHLSLKNNLIYELYDAIDNDVEKVLINKW